jgi:hypothetical protein
MREDLGLSWGWGNQGMVTAAIDLEILIRRLDFGRYGKLPV